MNRNFKGVWIPREIWLSGDLSLIEKCLLVEIDSLSSLEKGCFASNAYFSEFLGVSVPTITRAIKSLSDKNIIESKTIKNRDKKGKVASTRVIKMIKPPNQNDEATANQNDEYINTKPIIKPVNNIVSGKRFIKPSIKYIREYCEERNNNIDPEYFFNYYESKGWMIGKNKMKSWKAAIATWEKREKDFKGNKKRSVNDISGQNHNYESEDF